MHGFRFISMTVGIALLAVLPACTSLSTTATAKVSLEREISYYSRPGTGPTIIFQSGLGDGKNVWAGVVEQLPHSIPVLAYDRPGYGDSKRTSTARDPCSIAEELHQLTRQTGVSPPFVLVGHSMGGLYQYCYALRYPNEVAGLILIDPTHPDHLKEMKKQAPAQASLLNVLRYSLFTPVMRQEFDDQAASNDDLHKSESLAKPIRFLFSGKFRPEERGAFETMVRQLRRQWLSFSIDSEVTEIKDSGHYVQKEAPDMVVTAINQILTKTAGKSVEGFRAE